MQSLDLTLLKVIYHLDECSLSAMMGSKTRLKHFIYSICLQEESELLRNRFFKKGLEELEIVFDIFLVKVWGFQERLYCCHFK